MTRILLPLAIEKNRIETKENQLRQWQIRRKLETQSYGPNAAAQSSDSALEGVLKTRTAMAAEPPKRARTT